MILNVNIHSIFVIVVSYHYLLHYTHQYSLDNLYNANNSGRLFRPGIDGCSIPIPKNDPRKPTPSGLNDSKYNNIAAHNEYKVRPDQFLRYACNSGRIIAVGKDKIAPEIIIKCQGENRVEFREETHYYDDFTCEDFPDFSDIRVNSSSKSHLKTKVGPYDCFLPFNGIDYSMPIPFTANTTDPMIILPDLNGNLIITQNHHFKLACTGRGNEFMTPGPRGLNELTVKCLNGSFVEYRETIYTYLDFTCASVPKPELQLTTKTCHNHQFNVFDVGFQTQFYFLKLYRICFDMAYKNPMYTWYFANTPVYRDRQMPNGRLEYINTKTYADIIPNEAYYNQTVTVRILLRSLKMARQYIKREEGRILTPGHLVSKKAFVFTFQQWATYFYENTVPQWYIYTRRVWKDIQHAINDRLASDYTRHLIVTGVYNATHLTERENITHPFYLALPWSMTVPLYVWRMDYDLDRKNGTVYIAINNPYRRLDISIYFCEAMPCPHKRLTRRAYSRELVFCCSKKDFERFYGPVDPVVYEDF